MLDLNTLTKFIKFSKSKFTPKSSFCKKTGNCQSPKSAFTRAFRISELIKNKINVKNIYTHKVKFGIKKNEEVTTFIFSPRRVHVAGDQALFYK